MAMANTEVFQKMREVRRDFHKFPETGWAEFRTTSAIATILGKLGCKLSFGGEIINREDIMGCGVDIKTEVRRALEQGAAPELIACMKGVTGLVAEFDTGREGPLTVFCFDIDCVEVSESDSPDHLPNKLGFASVNKGRMHACAHDGHMAVGLALAEAVNSDIDKLCGRIRLIFEPAEEGVRGGYAMMKAGASEGADYLIAMHMGFGYPTGSVACGTKGFFCTKKFDAHFTGAGAHAANDPQDGKNALLAAATAALNIHAIAPNSEGVFRVNVGVLNAGEGRNVIPPSALMKIETRGETEELQNYAYDKTLRVLRGAAEMYDTELTVSKEGESVRAESDDELAAVIAGICMYVPGVKKTIVKGDLPISDDACWYMKQTQENGGKATYMCVGADIKGGHHSSEFDFDEDAMPIALDVLSAVLMKLNGVK